MTPEILAKLIASANEEPEKHISGLQLASYAENLVEIYQEFKKQNDFEPGDLVIWKRQCHHKKGSAIKPMIVVDLIDPPIFDNSKDSGSAYYREPLDMIIGEFDKDGQFLTYHMDSRRFEHYTGPMMKDYNEAH